jgi:hypothetical protein
MSLRNLTSAPLVTTWAWLATAALAATTAPPRPVPASTQDDAETSATLRIGESVTLEGSHTAITVADVSDDSRCPVDATCIWAGDATVTLRVQPSKGDAETVALHVGQPEARSVTVAGLRLRLERLEPAPRAGQTIAREQYRVVIAISKQLPQEDR